MSGQSGDSRTVLQAHRLRINLAGTALIHGRAAPRGRSISVRIVVISLLIASLLIVGIVITGHVVDLVTANRR